MRNEQSLRELKIFRELSCNRPYHQRNQKKIKGGAGIFKISFLYINKIV